MSSESTRRVHAATLDDARVATRGGDFVAGRPSVLRRLNERAVFEEILRRGTVSRGDLSRRLGVSSTTVAKIVDRLLAQQLIEDSDAPGHAEGRQPGRPGRVYRVAVDRTQVIGLTVDVRRCAVFGAGLDGDVRADTLDDFATPDTYPRLLDRLVSAVRAVARTRERTVGLGVSVPGEVDSLAQKVLLCPNLHLLDGRSPARDLSKRLKLPATLIHETVGTCLAEHAYGAARGMDDFVMIGVYEGYGCSAFVDGSLVVGHGGMAMEMGHITVDLNGPLCGCGNRGCLETLATDQAFARRVSKRLGRDAPVEEIVRLAGTGSLDVTAELDETLEYLAVGVAAAVNTFNPQAVLVCSRLFDAGRGVMGRLRERVGRRALPPLLAECELVRAAGDVRLGAVAGILDHLTASLGPELA